TTASDPSGTEPVDDVDGAASQVENAAPHNGDANNDNTLDSQQAQVASFVNPVTGKYVSLALDSGCFITDVTVQTEADQATADADYVYQSGLLDFTADCSAANATVKLYFYGDSDEKAIARKYNPTTGVYASIGGAEVSR